MPFAVTSTSFLGVDFALIFPTPCRSGAARSSPSPAAAFSAKLGPGADHARALVDRSVPIREHPGRTSRRIASRPGLTYCESNPGILQHREITKDALFLFRPSPVHGGNNVDNHADGETRRGAEKWSSFQANYGAG